MWAGLALLLVFGGPVAAQAGQPVKVEIVFMNHGPMQPVVKGLKQVLARHPQATASWYDFETDQGQDFLRKKGVKGHIPLLVFINGSTQAQVGSKTASFQGFPSGSGPYMFRGQWTMDDLDQALSALSSRP
jgi:hypothetical protein